MNKPLPIMSLPRRAWALLAGLLLLAGCATQPPAARPLVQANDLYVQGALAYQQGDRDRAVAALQSALQANPDLIMARQLLGTIYREKAEYAASIEQYRRVVELDPYVSSNHYNLGLVYHLFDRLQEAAAAYLKALDLNPEDFKSNMYLGIVYAALGKPEMGLPYVRKAADINPSSAEAAANLGVVQDSLRDYAAAEASYRRALELDPDRTEAAVNLARCLVAEKRYKEAVNVYERILKIDDSSMLRQRYGYALLGAGRVDDAVAQFNLALRQKPDNYQALNGLGDAMIAQYRQTIMLDEAKRNQAVAYWKRSIELNPEQPRIAALLKEYSEKSLFP